MIHFDKQNVLTNDKYSDESFDDHNDEIILSKFHDDDE